MMDRVYPEEEGTAEPRPAELLDLLLLKVRDLGVAVERRVEADLGDIGISFTEVRVLSVCAAHPGCTAIEISRLIPVDPPTISRLVYPMTQRGLLSRRRSRTDRREVRLRATANGLALLAEAHLALEQASVQVLSSLSQAELRYFQRAVENLLADKFLMGGPR